MKGVWTVFAAVATIVIAAGLYVFSSPWRLSTGSDAIANDENRELVDTSHSAIFQTPEAPGPQQSSTSAPRLSLRDSIRQRAEQESREFRDPVAPASRSSTGATDPLQCIDADARCGEGDPLAASSWDEAQWMRSRGFVDQVQRNRAQGWTDSELEDRYRNGDPAAVSELARRFAQSGEELAAKKVLSDAVRGGNVFAAHELAGLDAGRSRPHYSRPGLEWLFVARRLGDGKVTMLYILERYPNLQPQEIDHAMTVAERVSERLDLPNRPVERRPGHR